MGAVYHIPPPDLRCHTNSHFTTLKFSERNLNRAPNHFFANRGVMTNEDVDINGERRRIAIITGANGFVTVIGWRLMTRVLGVSIAQRLLEGVGPVAALEGVGGQEHERIRIILACRSRQKADVAVATLRKWFPERRLLLDVEDLDLCSMRNVEDFCQRMLKQ